MHRKTLFDSRDDPNSPFTALTWMFYAFGIDVCKAHKNRLKTTVLWLGHKLVATMLAFWIGKRIMHLFVSYGKVKASTNMSVIIHIVVVAAMYRTLRKTAEETSAVAQDILRLARLYRVAVSKRWIWVYSLAPLVLWLAIALAYIREDTFIKENVVQSLFSPSDVSYFYYRCFSTLSASALNYLFRYTFTSFYSVLLVVLAEIAARYIEQCTVHPLRDDPLAKFCFAYSRYKELLRALRRFDRLMSLPVFQILVVDAAGILFEMLRVLKYTAWLPLSTGVSLLFSSLSIMAISVHAARLNELDKVARRKNLKLLETCLDLDRKSVSAGKMAFFLRVNSEPAFAVTGWGLFDFTRRLYLTAIGTITTYVLLIATNF